VGTRVWQHPCGEEVTEEVWLWEEIKEEQPGREKNEASGVIEKPMEEFAEGGYRGKWRMRECLDLSIRILPKARR